MNVYQIAPKLVRIKLDSQLKEEFTTLDEKLEWRPLSTNLDSCEKAPHLYFRITINDAVAGSDFAGFPTGAPFILEREIKEDKKTFFLRHWVRKSSGASHEDLPLDSHPNLQIGAVDNRLILRVNIDREVDKNHVFKSIPFATNMFQVVQVDAIIHEMPHVRLAFAIERTLTPEERVNLGNNVSVTVAPVRNSVDSNAMHSAAHTQFPPGNQNPLGAVNGATANQTLVGLPMANNGMPNSNVPPVQLINAAPRMMPGHQMLAQHGPPALQFGPVSRIQKRQPGMTPHAVAPIHMRGQYIRGQSRQVPMQMRQTVPKRPMSATHQNMMLATRGQSKPITTSPSPNGSGGVAGGNQRRTGGQSTHRGRDISGSIASSSFVNSVGKTGHLGMMNENAKANTHPDVRLWEDHDANNPYEPLFISEDVKFMKRASESILMEEAYDTDKRLADSDLFGTTSGDLARLYDVYPIAYINGDEADIEICVDRLTKPAKVAIETDENSEETAYLKAVLTAVEYNQKLIEEREVVSSWLLKDELDEEQAVKDEDIGDNESGSE